MCVCGVIGLSTQIRQTPGCRICPEVCLGAQGVARETHIPVTYTCSALRLTELAGSVEDVKECTRT